MVSWSHWNPAEAKDYFFTARQPLEMSSLSIIKTIDIAVEDKDIVLLGINSIVDTTDAPGWLQKIYVGTSTGWGYKIDEKLYQNSRS